MILSLSASWSEPLAQLILIEVFILRTAGYFESLELRPYTDFKHFVFKASIFLSEPSVKSKSDFLKFNKNSQIPGSVAKMTANSIKLFKFIRIAAYIC